MYDLQGLSDDQLMDLIRFHQRQADSFLLDVNAGLYDFMPAVVIIADANASLHVNIKRVLVDELQGRKNKKDS